MLIVYYQDTDLDLVREAVAEMGHVHFRESRFWRGEVELPKVKRKDGSEIVQRGGSHVHILDGSPHQAEIAAAYEEAGCRVTILARPDEEQEAAEDGDKTGDGDKEPEAPEADKKPAAPPKKSRSRAAK